MSAPEIGKTTQQGKKTSVITTKNNRIEQRHPSNSEWRNVRGNYLIGI